MVVAEAVGEAGGNAFGGLIFIFAVPFAAIMFFLVRGLLADRVGAWGCAIPVAAFMALSALTFREQLQFAGNILLGAGAFGFLPVSAARAFDAWRHRSDRG